MHPAEHSKVPRCAELSQAFVMSGSLEPQPGGPRPSVFQVERGMPELEGRPAGNPQLSEAP